MSGPSGGTTLAAALILGVSVVAGSLVVRSALLELSSEVAGLEDSLAAARPTAAAAERPRRPEPGRHYAVDTKGSPVLGNPEARIAIVEFSDFQCPFCAKVLPTLLQIRAEYGDDIKIVFKHLPLSMHAKAPEAHRAAEAAHRQGKFWPMHDLIFGDQRGMGPEAYRRYAAEIGLDLERFERDMKDPALQRRVQADLDEAARLGVTGTPGFFINGRFLSGAQPFASFKRLIDAELGRG